MKKIIIFSALVIISYITLAQEVTPRPVTMEEYEKAKTYIIKDLDKDTYVKFGTDYVLDRYEMRKPYIITGDDGFKKRIDLYKLIAKDGMQELGTQIFYTNEKGKQYVALQPNFTANPKVWEKYFEDIHAIDNVEKNFVLKLSYILSKEMSFQLYKSMNNGKDMKEEAGTYGTDICFPGSQSVAMADGSSRLLRDIRPGDKVLTVDPSTHQPVIAAVNKLISHEEKNYAITRLIVINATVMETLDHLDVRLHTKVIEATPNHPMLTGDNQKKTISQIAIGESIICTNPLTKEYEYFKVINKTEKAGGLQKVYNMELDRGTTAVLNEIMVLQK